MWECSIFLEYENTGIVERSDVGSNFDIYTANQNLNDGEYTVWMKNCGLIDWCIENNIRIVYDDIINPIYGRIYRFRFETNEDAMVFKLEWL